MVKKRKYLIWLLCFIVCVSGCSSLDSKINGRGNASMAIDIAESTGVAIAKIILPIYKVFDQFAVWAALGSFIIGCCIIYFFHNSKSMTKIAIFSFMVFLPVLLIALDLGLGAWLSNCLY